MMSLGNNIRVARKKMGLTQEELASQVGVTSQAVSRWESGAGLPDISLVVPLAQVLSVSTDTLFGLDETRQDDALYMDIRCAYEQIGSEEDSRADTVRKQIDYLTGRLESDPANYICCTCLVEQTAELSRYVDFAGYGADIWEKYRNKAIQCGTRVIRFCTGKEWVERTHFALAWIYIHEKEFTSARDHISALPSVESNRLQESILAQVASFEHGTEEMKKVVRHNLQNFTRALNKEILYAVEDLAWSSAPEDAVEFAEWGIRLMHTLAENRDLLPYCRGFFRDIYKYMLRADLRAENYERAAMHYRELRDGMQHHFDCYQKILESEEESAKYPDRQLRNMRVYTKEFIAGKQAEILEQLKEWDGEEKYQKLCRLLPGSDIPPQTAGH